MKNLGRNSRYTLSIFFLTLIISTLKAQDDVVITQNPLYLKTKPAFHIIELGIRWMPTFSSLDVKTPNGGTVEGRTTVNNGYGGLVGINFSRHIGIQAEVIYNSISQTYQDQN